MVKTDIALKRVIVCPFDLIQSEEETWTELIEASTNFLSRTQFPQKLRIPLPLKHWANIPYVLSPQRIFVEPSMLNLQARACMDWLQFEFSDGAVVNWGVLLHSQYRDLVPVDLWPLTSKLQDMAKLVGKSADRHLAERVLSESSFEVIIAVIKISQSLGLNQIYLADSIDATKARRAFLLEKIFYDNAANSELLVQTQGGWVEGECKTKSAVFLKNSWGEDSIYYWSIFGFVPRLHQLIVSDLFFKLSSSDEFVRTSSLDGPKISHKNLAEPIKILNSPEELNDYLNRWTALGTRIHFKPLQSSRDITDLKIDFFVDEYKKIQTILTFAKDNLFALIDWRQFRKLLNCLSAGIGSISVESLEFGSSRRKTTKQNDQKLFKSQGIAAYVIFEISNFITQGRLSDGKVISDQQQLVDELFENCIEILDASKGRGVNEFEEFHVSPKAKGAFKEIINELFLYFEKKFFIFTPEQTLYLSYKDFLPNFLKNFLGFLSANTNKTLFLKMRDNAYNEFLDTNFSGEVLGARIFNKPPAEYPSEYFRNRGFYSPSPDKLLDFVLELSQDIGSVYFNGQRIDQINSEDLTVEFQVRENKKIDWFELHPVVFFEGHEIHHKDIQWNLSSGILHFQGKLFLIPKNKIPSLKRLEKFWERLRSSSESAGHEASESYFPLPKSETLEMLALRASGFQVKGSKKWDEVCKFFDNLGKPLAESDSINKIIPQLKIPLKPYQVLGVSWLNDLYQLRLGGILADEMGLGKTSQMIGFFESLRLRGELKTCMVVVPASLTYNWLSEAKKFAPELKLIAFDKSFKEEYPEGLGLDSDTIVVITYGLLVEHEEYISKTQWNIVAFDEAQQLKNLGAQRTTIARKLKAQFKVCITGTPMENHLGEFFSLVDLVVPGSLGSREEFRTLYQNKELPPSPEALNYLRLKVKPLLLRRVKSEIQADLPEKMETVVCLDFDSQQKKIYRDIASACNESVRSAIEEKGAAQSQLEMLTALMRLRQVCSDPLGIASVKYDGVPPKITQLLDSIESIIESGDSVLVFTQFLKTLERIENLLKSRGINVYTLHGSIQRKDREKYLKAFSESDKPGVMLMTLKTGGVGLNLTKASYVFHLEPWWNPAVEDQATDRAHRIGQEKKVNVYRYIMRDSLEEKIEVLKERKMKLFKDLLNTESVSEAPTLSTQESGNLLSAQDFAYLLS